MREKAILFIHALTSLHPGSGTALGVVDLPVQRERHTQWPLIPGSSLKGILRDRYRSRIDSPPENPDEDEKLCAVFGPPTTSSSEHAGALSITDARILAFPVRSMKGVFALVTCPEILLRLHRDLSLAGQNHGHDISRITPDGKKAFVSKNSPLRLEDGKLILEEFDFDSDTGAEETAEWLAPRISDDPATQESIRRRLVILSDDDFTYFVRHATEVVARVGLNYETKTVNKGALFYEEFLPPETFFYSLVFADDSRRRTNGQPLMAARDIIESVEASLRGIIQIGGDETIGKGICAVRIEPGKE